MSDASNSSFPDFGKFVPGFDFLQNLATQAAGSAAQKMPQMPSLGSWVAPTLNVEELDKRIQELKAVQFWLDQNAMALKATVQALEVQKMTLATLKGMNFNMGDVASAFKLKVADSPGEESPQASPKANPFPGLEIPPTNFGTGKAAKTEAPEAPAARAKPAKEAAAPGVVDPMAWWGALTQQFQAIATDALKDAKKNAPDGSPSAATALAQSATGMATDMARGMLESAGKTMAGGARAARSTALRSSQAWPSPTSKKAAATSRPAAKTAAPARKAPRKAAR